MNGISSIFWQFFIARHGSKVYDIVVKTSMNGKEYTVFIKQKTYYERRFQHENITGHSDM